MLAITLRYHVRNDRKKPALNVEKTIIDIIRNKQMQWLGHVCRLPSSSYMKIVYKDGFVGKRRKGRPTNRW